MEKIFVRPVAGRIVRDPATMEPLPEAGAYKPKISYWLRRVADGSVIVAEADGAAHEAENGQE